MRVTQCLSNADFPIEVYYDAHEEISYTMLG